MNIKLENFKDKEVFVRKNLVRFIENLFKFLGCNLDHDRFKKVLYAEDSFRSEDEERIKRAYDAYLYLLYNSKNPLTNKILNTFFYIYFEKEIDKNVSLRIATKYFQYVDKPVLESSVDFHIDVFNEIDCANDEDKLVISLIFYNYVLAKNNIPTSKFMSADFDLYLEKKEKYLKGNKIYLYEFFLELIENGKVQDKSYYQNLRDISIKEIYQALKEDEEYLKNNFEIKHLSIFGSFAKGINRIDSDVDLLASFSLDLTSLDKRNKINEFKKIYFNKFNRFIDVSEVSEYLNDEFIKKITYVKNIF